MVKKDESNQSIESDENYRNVDAKLKPAMRSGSVTVGDNVDLLDTNMPIQTTGNNDEDEDIVNEDEIANFNRALGIPSPGLPSKKKAFAASRARSQSIL